MENTKKKVAVSIGDCTENLEAMVKTLNEQKVIDNIQVTFFSDGQAGMEKMFDQVHGFDAVIAMPIENVDIAAIWKKKWNMENTSHLYVSGNFKYIVLVDEQSNDIGFLPNIDVISQKIQVFSEYLKRCFRLPLPRIGVMSTSKQADANLTKEDETILIPAINKAFDELIPVFGPFAKDVFFASENFLRFDGLVLPVKEQTQSITQYFDGFNLLFEMNAPFILTTPLSKTDHPEAVFRETLFTVSDMLRNEVEYDEISKNPLKFELKRENNEFQAF